MPTSSWTWRQEDPSSAIEWAWGMLLAEWASHWHGPGQSGSIPAPLCIPTPLCILQDFLFFPTGEENGGKPTDLGTTPKLPHGLEGSEIAVERAPRGTPGHPHGGAHPRRGGCGHTRALAAGLSRLCEARLLPSLFL